MISFRIRIKSLNMDYKLYEAPVCEVVVVKMESALLQGSLDSTSASRNGYGAANVETWE